MDRRLPLVCAYENRPEYEDGVRVLVASLHRASPDMKLRLFHNPGSADFGKWLEQFPNVDWRPAELPAEQGWNIKPHVLLDALDDGHEQVVWLDADLLVASDITAIFAQSPANEIIFTEEASWGASDDADGRRAKGWGFAVGRVLPFTANSCVLKLSTVHRGLIEAWRELLLHPDYRAAQASDWTTRPPHMMGDQDVLTALLCSERFADIPVKILRRGKDILQLFGPLCFSVKERLTVLTTGLPYFIHAQGTKPWKVRSASAAGKRPWYEPLFLPYQDTSPYTLFVVKYLKDTCKFGWLVPQVKAGRALRAAGMGSLTLAGLPVAAVFDAVYGSARLAKGLFHRSR